MLWRSLAGSSHGVCRLKGYRGWLHNPSTLGKDSAKYVQYYQENLEYLDRLKAAIPGLHEHMPVIKVLDAPMDLVTERAIELLKELQVEYKIHPLLEEDNAFSQG